MWKIFNKNIEIANRHYYKVLIATYIIVGALALLIMITSILSWFNSYVKKQVFEMGIEQVDTVDIIFENSITSYHTQLQNAFQEPDIKNYLYSASSEFAREYKISRFLKNIISNNEVIDYIGLYRNHEVDMIVGNVYPEHEEQKEVKLRLEDTIDDMHYFIIKNKNKPRLCIFQTEREYLHGKPERGVIFVINLEKLQNKLLNQNNNGNYLFVINNDGSILIQKNEVVEITQIWNKIRDLTQKYINMEIELNNTKYICTIKYNIRDKTYIVMLQDFQLNSYKLREAGNYIFVICIPVLLLVLVISFFMANKIYDPLDKFLNQLWNNSTLIENSEHNKLQMTSDNILNQIDTLSKQYYSNKILQYLSGSSETDIMPGILKLSDRDEQCILAMFFSENTFHELNELSKKIYGYAEELFQGCKIYLFKEEIADYFILLIKEQKKINKLSQNEECKTKIGIIINEIAQKDELRIFCSMSKVIEHEKDLRVCFNDVLSYIKYNIIGQCDSIMDIDSMNDKIDSDIPKKYYNDIIDDLKAGDSYAAINEFKQLLKKINNYEIKRVFFSLTEFAAEMNQIACYSILHSKQYQSIYMNHYIKITTLYDIDQLILYFSQLIMKTCLEVTDSQEKSIQINMMKSIAYIHEHFKDDIISIEYIADHFHISISYYSRLFNEYTGMSFPEYVNDLRLSYAKNLLLTSPEDNVKKVAKACGFSSDSYFSAQFKKKYNVSPSFYRKSR